MLKTQINIHANTNNIVLNFLSFLNNTSENMNILRNISLEDNFLNDFYQTNWEIIVETMICSLGKEFLEVYGEGADCNKNSSRVSFSEKQPTHRIICRTKDEALVIDKYTNEKIELDLYKFNSFVSLNNDFVFDGILLEHLINDDYAMIECFEIEFIKVSV